MTSCNSPLRYRHFWHALSHRASRRLILKLATTGWGQSDPGRKFIKTWRRIIRSDSGGETWWNGGRAKSVRRSEAKKRTESDSKAKGENVLNVYRTCIAYMPSPRPFQECFGQIRGPTLSPPPPSSRPPPFILEQVRKTWRFINWKDQIVTPPLS